MPGWALNVAVDELLKKEFDYYRKLQKPHPMMLKNKLNFVPFKHKDIDHWRNARTGGISYLDEKTNLIIHGGIDDVWFNTETEELIVADYKSQHKKDGVSQETYFDDPYKDGYKRQLDYYAYLLNGMGYKVSSDAYLYICNAKEIDEGFHGKMLFDEVLIHYKIKTDYLETEIQRMIDTMNSEKIPNSHDSCENCAYARQRSVIDKLGGSDEK